MILCNHEIHKALDERRLIISPEPKPREPEISDDAARCPFDTHSVDLTLSNIITVPEPGTYAYDLNEPTPLANFITRNSRSYTIDDYSSFVLERQQFVLGMTREFVGLPIRHPKNLETKTCLAARIEGKSSRARVGLLIHFTAPTVHPGWGDPTPRALTLEMINLGPARIILKPRMPIAQLIIEQVQGLPFENPSQFKSQTTPEGNSGDTATTTT